MNTLSRIYTRKFFVATDYQTFRQHWSHLVTSERKRDLKASHHLLYLVLIGRDWRKGFTFPTNPKKLNNGYDPALHLALFQLSSPYAEDNLLAPFDGLVSKEALVEARGLLSHVLKRRMTATPQGFPTFDAYLDPGTINPEMGE